MMAQAKFRSSSRLLLPSFTSSSATRSSILQIVSHRAFRRPLFLLILFSAFFLLYSAFLSLTSSSSRRKESKVTFESEKSPLKVQETKKDDLYRLFASSDQDKTILYNHHRGFNDTMKMNFVRKMMEHAWGGYMRWAKGGDELNAASGSAHFWNPGQSQFHTPVDAMDTLWIMDMKKEYEEAKLAVLENMRFDTWTKKRISVFETTIRALGGILSAYDLDGDERLLRKAIELADLLMNSFSHSSGIPLNYLDVQQKTAMGFNGINVAYLAEYGSLQLELQYLSDVTGNRTYQEKTLRLFDFLNQTNPSFPGLYPQQLVIDTLGFANDVVGIGAMSDSFYEYLLKVWLSTKEERFRDMFEVSADSLIEHVLTYSPLWNISYLPDRNNYHKLSDFNHLTCFTGGWFALGALSRRSHKTGLYLDVAHRITHGCYTMYENLTNSVGFEEISMSMSPEYSGTIKEYRLRPELVESLVYMWRFTHDPIYRQWGWNIAQSIEAHCKTRFGYQGLPREKYQVQESFFLAETLKYLFLLFTDDNVLSFEEYVFNTEAHPLSIRGFGKRSDPAKWVPIESNYYLINTALPQKEQASSKVVEKQFSPQNPLQKHRKSPRKNGV